MTEISASVLPTDDTGDGVSGTIWNRAYEVAYKAAIDALIHSATNPTVTPEDIIDEVVVARGSLGNLNARISGSLKANGDLIDALLSGIPTLSRFTTTVNSVGATPTDAAVITTLNLRYAGAFLEFDMVGRFAATAFNKIIQIVIDGNTHTVIPSGAYNDVEWHIKGFYMLDSSGTRLGTIIPYVSGTPLDILQISTSPGVPASDFAFKLVLTGVNNNDVAFYLGCIKEYRAV